VARLRNWWKQRPERRDVRRRYRSARGDWVRERVTGHLRPKNIGLSLALGFGSVFVYGAWAKLQETPFDPASLLAALVPPVTYVVGTWLYYRVKAPAQLFDAQRRQLEQLNPPTPWVVAVEVAEEERRITVQLLLSDRFTGTTQINSATCFFEVGNVRPRCDTPKSGAVSQTQALAWQYPDEFVPVVWPLPSGRYEAVVTGIRSPSTRDTAHTIGGQFQVGKPKWWRR
jgi:hypothetical protein